MPNELASRRVGVLPHLLVLVSMAGAVSAQTAVVVAAVETTPVSTGGDAADDPAVWVHPLDRSLSTIIGTNKDAGLGVYDLGGQLLQFLPGGELNNVDLRYRFPLGGKYVDLVTSGERSANVLAIYAVDPNTRLLASVAARAIPIGVDTYGCCMYRSPVTDDTYVFVTSEDGPVEQWKLFDAGAGKVDAVLVRSFDVGSQCEGCVADDENAAFFVSEEEVGIWRYGAEPNAGSARVLVDGTGVGGHLTSDVEGLGLYYANDGGGYLLASSQGSNTYVVYERKPPHVYRATFQIGDNLSLGIDGVSETDGIEVLNVGLAGAFADGIFIAQDGANVGGNQNFKLVPWSAIAGATTPPLLVDPLHDVHETDGARARTTLRNGSGINPVLLTSNLTPRLGSVWRFELDCAGHAPSNAFVFAVTEPATGPRLAAGEFLVDLASTRLFSLAGVHAGNVLHFSLPIPLDIGLCGAEASLQALVRGAPGPKLSNAIDLLLGVPTLPGGPPARGTNKGERE